MVIQASFHMNAFLYMVDTHTSTHKTNFPDKETRCVLACGQRAPGLKHLRKSCECFAA